MWNKTIEKRKEINVLLPLNPPKEEDIMMELFCPREKVVFVWISGFQNLNENTQNAEIFYFIPAPLSAGCKIAKRKFCVIEMSKSNVKTASRGQNCTMFFIYDIWQNVALKVN